MRRRSYAVTLAAAAVLTGAGCVPDSPPAVPELHFTRAATLPEVDLTGPRTVPVSPRGAVLRKAGSGTTVVGDLVVERLRVVDGRTGRVRWTARSSVAGDPGDFAGPVGGADGPGDSDSGGHPQGASQVRVDGDEATLYVVVGSGGPDDSFQNFLVAVDVVRGRTLWTVPVGGEYPRRPWWKTLFKALPPLSRDTEVRVLPDAVVVGGGPAEEFGDRAVYAFDPRSGRRLWRHDGDLEAAEARAVLIGADDGEESPSTDGVRRIKALRPRDGRELWSTRTAGEVRTGGSGTVLVTDDSAGTVRLHAAEDGTTIRRLPANAEDAANYALDGCAGATAVYVCMAGNRATGGLDAVGIDARTGAERWRTGIAEAGFAGVATVTAITPTHVLLESGYDGVAAALDPRTGRPMRTGMDRVALQAGNGFTVGRVLGKSTSSPTVFAATPVGASAAGRAGFQVRAGVHASTK